VAPAAQQCLRELGDRRQQLSKCRPVTVAPAAQQCLRENANGTEHSGLHTAFVTPEGLIAMLHHKKVLNKNVEYFLQFRKTD
jgi:hypothetical protein